MKNKLLIYLETQYKGELIGFRTFKAYTSLQYAVKRLATKGAQLVSMVILHICFQISPGIKLHSKSVNSTKVN
jgi:hypothetical protein